MQNDWILDVLSDLRAYARANGLPCLAQQIDATRMVALAEIATGKPDAGRGGRHDEQGDRSGAGRARAM